MSFYDDLKKPEQKYEPPRYMMTDKDRQDVAHSLCGDIMLRCSAAKKEGKRSYHGYGHWWRARVQGDRYEVGFDYMATSCTEKVGHFSIEFCTPEERDKILPLLRRELAAQGFPADAVRAHDHWMGGGLVFNKIVAHIIEVNVRW